MLAISGLRDLGPRYDAILCDVWGVVHNGRQHFAAACDALTRFRAGGGVVVLVTNAPRPNAPIRVQLDGLGVPRAAWAAFVSSGDATRTLLAERAPGPAWAPAGQQRRPPPVAGPLSGCPVLATSPAHARLPPRRAIAAAAGPGR